MNEYLKNTLKVAGEVLVTPGISLLGEGKTKDGMVHAGVGLVGRALIGLPGILLVGASSFIRSRKKTEDDLIEADGDDRVKDLNDKVRSEMEAGLSLEEIKAGIQEDIEDAYFEARQNNKPEVLEQ